MSTLYKLEQALAMLAQHHRSMGHEPLMMMAIARQSLMLGFDPSALQFADYELSQMDEATFHDAVLGSETKVQMSNLTSEVLMSMLSSVTKQDAIPGMVFDLSEDDSQTA